jgi:hypothetical protein
LSGLLFCSALAACAHQPTCEPTRTLYVVDHGWHSGIVVEREELVRRLPALAADLPGAPYLEIGWGEERFYRARETTLGMALRAVLRPNPSVLQVVPFSEIPHSTRVHTDDAGYAATLDFIAATFKPQLRRLGPSQYGAGWFYPAKGSFHLFNTCNNWVNAALDKARCRARIVLDKGMPGVVQYSR